MRSGGGGVARVGTELKKKRMERRKEGGGERENVTVHILEMGFL